MIRAIPGTRRLLGLSAGDWLMILLGLVLSGFLLALI